MSFAETVGAPTGIPRGTVGICRGLGWTIFLTVITFGIYGLVWTYWVFKENQRWSDRGLGGTVGLIVAVFAPGVTFFLLPDEIERLYEQDGRTSPVSALTGLWFLLPLVGVLVWYVKTQRALNAFWESKGASPP